MLSKVSDLKIGEKIITKNKQGHITVLLVASIDKKHCQLHGEYICMEYGLRKVRSDGRCGSTGLYSEDTVIEYEKLYNEQFPVCECSGCVSNRKNTNAN